MPSCVLAVFAFLANAASPTEPAPVDAATAIAPAAEVAPKPDPFDAAAKLSPFVDAAPQPDPVERRPLPAARFFESETAAPRPPQLRRVELCPLSHGDLSSQVEPTDSVVDVAAKPDPFDPSSKPNPFEQAAAKLNPFDLISKPNPFQVGEPKCNPFDGFYEV